MVRRIFIERNTEFDNKALILKNDLFDCLGIKIDEIRVIDCYDIEGLDEDELVKCRYKVFAKTGLDRVYGEELMESLKTAGSVFTYKALPGQFDSRADSAKWSIAAVTGKFDVHVVYSRVLAFGGTLPERELSAIKRFLINPVESVELPLEKPHIINAPVPSPASIPVIDGFITLDKEGLKSFREKMGLSMNEDDIALLFEYFKKEQRNPTVTEIKVLDTYWSDHCRHSTFMTSITDVQFVDSQYKDAIKKSYELYQKERAEVYRDRAKDESLMDIAVMGMKALRAKGFLNDLDESEEVNACSINIDVDVDGKIEKWLFMFKNETHNHPTEIEPFGGASTCLGGGIRDPLSGRSLVYQAMRITGAGDPRTPVSETIPGKLPQIVITRTAASGYSSYGNQIGAASGLIREIYDPGFVAKRMELGALVAAAPKENVLRGIPVKGDVVILLGGKTGRDGCGGATGSSRGHTEESFIDSGAEVQKGNPPLERDIQRLFVNPVAAKLIKRCNDFGAGGVSVAVGELADGLLIDLDKVPVKYDGLDGTELAISESQERMAVVVAKSDAEKFIAMANAENADATIIAEVTDDRRLTMLWRGEKIVSISRDFLDLSGARRQTKVTVGNYDSVRVNKDNAIDLNKWLSCLSDLNVCAQKGLVDQFDATVGANTVLMPYGGKYGLTPALAMAAKIPTEGETNTASLMAYGYNPEVSKKSPYHGAAYAVVESLANIVATGGDYRKARLTFQEYFESLGNDPLKWGKPFAALLGAFDVQMGLFIPSIGGKDSMSGTFNDLTVPPTLVSFAVCIQDVNNIISPEFKHIGSEIVVVNAPLNDADMPCYDALGRNFDVINKLIVSKKIASASTVGFGGLCAALSKMAFGNKTAFEVETDESLFSPSVGAIVVEYTGNDANTDFLGTDFAVIGKTVSGEVCTINKQAAGINEMLTAWLSTLEPVFPTRFDGNTETIEKIPYCNVKASKSTVKIAKPTVLIPVFAGTNGERDMRLAFERAGAVVELCVLKNRTLCGYKESVKALAEAIEKAQILAIPGGGLGDEPAGMGTYIGAVLSESAVTEAVNSLLSREGLILGIDAGFNGLIKAGFMPGVSIAANTGGQHVSAILNTVVVSAKSPWLSGVSVGDVYKTPVSTMEGRIILNDVTTLTNKGQIATQYANESGIPSMDTNLNPLGTALAIEGITNENGRIFGKIGHSERFGNMTYRNMTGNYDMKIFESGVKYYA